MARHRIWLWSIVVAVAGVVYFGPALMEASFGGCEFAGERCTKDGSGWRVENVEVTGNAVLRVTNGDHVSLSNVVVKDAKLVKIQIHCDCAVRGEEFTLSGTGADASVYLMGAGENSRHEISLDGLTVTGFHRLDIFDAGGPVTISNLAMSCKNTDPYALTYDAVSEKSTLQMTDSVVDACGRFIIHAFGTDVASRPPVPVTLERVHLIGTGVDDGGNDGISGPEAGMDLIIRNSTLTNFRYALHLRSDDSLVLQDSTVEHNVDAIGLSEGSSAKVDNSTISDNRYGIRVWDGSRIEVFGSDFLRNDARPDDCGGGAISGRFTGWVHQSSFIGNSWGISGGPLDFDARNNYWGSPTGPTTAQGCGGLPLVGDAVLGPVLVVPFLILPPA